MKDEQRIIGLMSGTSLDGIDLAYCTFKNSNFSILEAKTFHYNKKWIEELKSAHELSSASLLELDAKLALYFSSIIKAFILEFNISKVDAIASHGHTVFHQPDKSYTLQIANPSYIASLTGYTVIGDFRSGDIALGGQGAPLVPIGDRDLFSSFQNRINLGGFANTSYEENSETYAFDICPVNILLNEYAAKLGQAFDENGSIARSGKLIEKLLHELDLIEYYQIKGPKSLGKEYVQSIFSPIISQFSFEANEDILRTLTEHMAKKIASSLRPGKALFTGGGVFNQFLMERIQKLSKNEIVVPDNLIIDFKEALIFAYLGHLRLRNEVNVLASVTGASNDHISGGVFLP